MVDAGYPYLEPLDQHAAQQTIRDYVCSRCSGHLIARFAPDRQYWVVCAVCEGATEGYTSQYHVRLAKERARWEAQEVAATYRALYAAQLPKKSARTIKKELGYDNE